MGLDEKRLSLANIREDTNNDYTDIYYRLSPYTNYLREIKKYRERDDQIPIHRYKLHRNAGSDKPWILIENLQDEQIREVFEHDQNREIGDFSEKGIKIIDRDPNESLFQLERMPRTKELKIRPNTSQIKKQLRALRSLVDGILECMPLMDLFRDRYDVEWPDVQKEDVKKWYFLNNDEYDGVDKQREFVKKAMATPDFAFLEGPPGSGKTTVLCELVQQMVLRGKRVMICASTHIAVDNLIEKLTDKNAKSLQKDMIIVRIGESRKISEKIEPCKYNNFVKNTRKVMMNHLEKLPRTKSSEILEASLKQSSGKDVMEEIICDCANVVCGTTIGILQYPDLKDDAPDRRFDMMIIDEASKTTFQEFLVPAIPANRWVIVGDTMQLAPYTDEGEVAENIEHALESKYKNLCLDTFQASRRKSVKIVVVTDDEDIKSDYKSRCERLDVKYWDANDEDEYNKMPESPQVILGSAKSISAMNPPSGKVTIRNHDQLRVFLESQKKLGKKKKSTNSSRLVRWIRICNEQTDSVQKSDRVSWGRETGRWLRRNYENLTAGQNEPHDAEKISENIQDLLPDDMYGDAHEAKERLNAVQRIAFPSILSSIQHGFPGDSPSKYDTVIENGMPVDDFEKRHILLNKQYRMHSDIAEFSHKYVYERRALETPDMIDEKRSWSYSAYTHRLVWMDIKGKWLNEANLEEANCIISELEKFCKFATKNPRPGGGLWEVAILSFYRKHEAVIRGCLRTFSKKPGYRTFKMLERCVSIEVCTVDAFQGHEADIVFLSMGNRHATSFLNNRNRLNVAVTRARYQCVVIGDKDAMSSADSPLCHLAEIPDLHEVK